MTSTGGPASGGPAPDLTPRELLRAGVTSWRPHLQPDGTLHDPVFGQPTQYGTAYLAWCCAVLAEPGAREVGADEAGPDEVERAGFGAAADRALRAALAHTADVDAVPHASTFDRATLSVVGRGNHRDFTWPPILGAWSLLGGSPRAGADGTGGPLGGLAPVLAGVDVETAFRARPPSNWAMVWLLGEWRRMRAGLSPTSEQQFDGWIEAFFTGPSEQTAGFDETLGLYRERGLPEAYDLFTRVHLTQLLADGWSGRDVERVRTFLAAGLRRSLDRQLSDGSLASGYRSAGQTWVLGAQVALFTLSPALGLGSADDQAEAGRAAWRAYRQLARWQRPGGVFSPVQNLLPPELRAGYESYTADGHYAPLALAFLATAVRAGFGDGPAPSAAELDAQPPRVRAEGSPTHRGSARLGRIAVAVQAQLDPAYDASGLVDLTFGVERTLVLVGAARPLTGGVPVAPGLAVGTPDEGPAGPVTSLGTLPRPAPTLTPLDGPPTPEPVDGRLGLQFAADTELGTHRFAVALRPDGVEVVETLEGWTGPRTLLLPYLRDLGDGVLTEVAPEGEDGVVLQRGRERLVVRVDGPLARLGHLPGGWESRRGFCGLLRLDLATPGPTLRWSLTSTPAPPP